MNKAELVNALIEKSGSDIVTKAQATRLLGNVLDIIKDEVAGGNEVAIVGFGTFKPVHKEARKGRNVATGEAIDIPAKTVPKFVPGKSFKDAVNK
jgi:DNA-binding protein HU-beta